MPVTTTPDAMTAEDREAFIAFVRASGEVNCNTLPALVKNAKALVTIHEGETLIGTAAIKNPNANHRKGDFSKAGCQEQAAAYPFELGWVHVDQVHRKRGHSSKLVEKAMKSVGEEGVYATTKNDVMRKNVLPKFGFEHTGSDFPSVREPNKTLSLFTRPARR